MPDMSLNVEVREKLEHALEAMDRREQESRSRPQAVARTYLETAILWWSYHMTFAPMEPPPEPPVAAPSKEG